LSTSHRPAAAEGRGQEPTAAPARENLAALPSTAALAANYEELRADLQLLKRQVLRIAEQLDDEGDPIADGDGSESPRAGKRRLRGLAVAAIVIVAGLAAGGSRLWSYFNSYESTDDAQVDGHIAPVSARIAGTVIHVYVEDNQIIPAGTLLAEIDPRDFQIALDRARATLAQAQAQVAIIAQQQLSAAAQVQGYEASKERAERDRERFGVLYQGSIVAQQSYERTIEGARVAAASVAAARAVDSAMANSMASARGAVDEAKAAVAQAQLALGYTRITAPVAGIVGKRSVEVGQRIVPGQQLLGLIENHNIWITANYMETQAGRMHAGLPVQIYVDALGETFAGMLESISGASGEKYSLLPPENATGNYVKVVQRIPVRIALKPGQHDAGQLRPGMSVETTVWFQ
jgi:membrane fusion protein, multidrug efflux system